MTENTHTLDRETALLSLQSIQSGSLTDLAVVMRALINGDLTETDITDLLSVESPPASEVLFREDGVGKVMTWADFLAAIAEELGSAPAATPGTYFFDSVGGNDANNGRSAAAAFQSISRFNSKTFLPGDIISFKRGQTHSGSLLLPSSGTAAAPIVINSFGSGAAPVISSGEDSGFVAVDKSYFTLDGIEFVGARDPLTPSEDVIPNSVDGIYIENGQAGDTALAGIRVQNCTVSHYGAHGIHLIGTNGASGFAAPLIDNNDVSACTHNLNDGSRQAGIRVSAYVNFGADANGYVHSDVIIRGNTVHDNLGTLNDTDLNGSGISIGQTDGAIVTGNIVSGNGTLSAFPTGPYGIRVEDSNDITIDNNEAYNNQSVSTVVDGGGIGILGGCTNCVVEKNYIHGNRGSGIVCYASALADLKPWDANTVRFNVLEDNDLGDFPLGAGIAIIADANLIGAEVYNNTIYQRGGPAKNCLLLSSTTGVTVDDFEGYIANNILVTLNGAALVRAVNVNPTFLRLRGNDYYAAGTFLIHWNGANYASLAAWQAVATTQEKISAVNVAQIVDPLLTNPATGGVINADNSLLTGYKLQSISPMRTTGLDLLAQFSIDPGSTDFFGGTIGVTFNVGASYLTKNAALTISGNPTLTALTTSAYASWTATAAGGTGAYTYALVGTWPSGITIHSTTGVVSGTAASSGTFTPLSVRVTDTGTSETVDLSPVFTLTVASAGVATYTIAPIITPDAIFGGYAGSVWTCTPANWSVGTPTHQWYADGVAIGGATASTYTMTIANEGKVISCRETIGAVVAASNTIELWLPSDLVTAQPVAVFDIRQGITEVAGAVSAWAATIGGVTASQATGAAKPTYSATALGGAVPGMTYDGGDSLTGVAISLTPAARTVVAIGQWANSTLKYPFLFPSGANGYFFRRNTNNGQFEHGNIGTAVMATSTTGLANTVNTPKVIGSRLIPSGASSFSGGGVVNNTTTATGGGFTGTGTQSIGPTTVGVLGTMVIVDAYVTDDEFARLAGWVAWTSGYPFALNPGSTYKTAAPRSVTLTATVVAVTVPEGTQEEEILSTIPTSIVGGTYTITARGEGMSIVDGDLIISDKELFFAEPSPTASIRVSKSGLTSQLFTVNCTLVPGYYDVGAVAGANSTVWYDFADHKTIEVDEGDTYIKKLKSKSSGIFFRDQINPWYQSRRQKLVANSSLKAGRAGMRNIFSDKDTALYGLACLENPPWHGMRSVAVSSTSQLSFFRALAPSNQDTDRTAFTGLPAMFGRNLLVVAYGDSTGMTLRLDGVQVQKKLPSTGVFAYQAPLEPFLIAFTIRTTTLGHVYGCQHFGQGPIWESTAYGGDITEFMQFVNVSVVP